MSEFLINTGSTVYTRTELLPGQRHRRGLVFAVEVLCNRIISTVSRFRVLNHDHQGVT